MREAFYRGYKIVAFMPVGQDEKWKVVLAHGNVVEHIDLRKNSQYPTEKTALAHGLYVASDRMEAQDALLDELSKEAPVDLPQKDVPSVGWVVPDKGWASDG